MMILGFIYIVESFFLSFVVVIVVVFRIRKNLEEILILWTKTIG